LNNGEKYTSQVDYPKGSIQNPMNDSERWDKFQQLSGPILDEDKQKKVQDMVFEMEKVKDVSELLTLLTGKE
jgi:2-methylcitrate dehydratase PrpD